MSAALLQVPSFGFGADQKKVATSEVSPVPSSIYPGSTEPGDGHAELSEWSGADSDSEAGEAGDASVAAFDGFEQGEGGEEGISVEHWSIVAARLALVFQFELEDDESGLDA